MNYKELQAEMGALLEDDPVRAVERARQIDSSSLKGARLNWANLKAVILIDGGTESDDLSAVEEGLALMRVVNEAHPTAQGKYNLANALAATIGRPSGKPDEWLRHHQKHSASRREARELFWNVANDNTTDDDLRSRAWTNLSNQFEYSYRMSEAHDARLTALKFDPTNAVAASLAIKSLDWLSRNGYRTESTSKEVEILSGIVRENPDRLVELGGRKAAEALANTGPLPRTKKRNPHQDPFLIWVEAERLTLAPTVELVDPDLGDIDWLMLPPIMEVESIPPESAAPPPVFTMFNVIKSDFLCARNLTWQSIAGSKASQTGRLADTKDGALYGAEISGLVLAHRAALDTLDKVGVFANQYFNFGFDSNKIHFGSMWRERKSKEIHIAVMSAIEKGAVALFGLLELADDYGEKGGILWAQKDMRNAGTHRFSVIHDSIQPNARTPAGIQRFEYEEFLQATISALKTARSAIQLLVFCVAQKEHYLQRPCAGRLIPLPVDDFATS